MLREWYDQSVSHSHHSLVWLYSILSVIPLHSIASVIGVVCVVNIPCSTVKSMVLLIVQACFVTKAANQFYCFLYWVVFCSNRILHSQRNFYLTAKYVKTAFIIVWEFRAITLLQLISVLLENKVSFGVSCTLRCKKFTRCVTQSYVLFPSKWIIYARTRTWT